MTHDHIIVLPGGSYESHSAIEGEPVAEWLRSLGLASSVFLYPAPALHPAPLDAIVDEVRRLRAAGADRVAVMGFSAGGHAAGHAALLAREKGTTIDLAVLGYPVVSMRLAHHEASRHNLVGVTASDELRTRVSLEHLVTRSSPPFFVWHTNEDQAVPVEHSYLLGAALAAHAVPHELHIFERGPHGLGLAREEPGASRWTALCETWLRARGWIR